MAEPRECKRCHEVKVIAGRGLCKKCHTRVRYLGELENYPKDNASHKSRYDICVDCGEYTHIFGKDRCKKCHGKFWRSQPGWKEKHAEWMREERKNKPEIYRAIEKRRRETDKRKSWRRKWQKDYYQKNPQTFLNATRKWTKKNPGIWGKYKQVRLARESDLSRTLTNEEWESIVKQYHYVCVYCGCSDKRLTQDHWIPLTRRGEYTKDNIVPACQSCNSRKGTMTGDEFIELLDLQEWEKMRLEFDKICAS